jgi:two-component system response regulator GlrR
LPFAKARDHFEFDYLTHLLEMTEGNVAQAARLAERNRSEFYKLLRKHELEPELFRRGDRTD